MIFPVLKTENVVQIDDQTRLDATSSYTSPDETSITLIEIEPETGVGFIDVTSERYLDWQYPSSGTKTVTVRVTTDSTPTTSTKDIEVKTKEEDNLFSLDTDLVNYEDDILSYVRDGRNSFIDKHRTSQEIILNDLDANKFWKEDGTRYTAGDIVDIQEFKQWSIFLTLKVICRSLSNQVDDLWDRKANEYSSRSTSAKKRAVFRLDADGDNEINEKTEKFDNQVARLIRG
jgi:hypothetical protein